MADDEHPLTGKLEPEAKDGCRNLTEAATLSLAISMKRIADAMTAPTNEYGETMAEAVGGNIRRALQDARSLIR